MALNMESESQDGGWDSKEGKGIQNGGQHGTNMADGLFRGNKWG